MQREGKGDTGSEYRGGRRDGPRLFFGASASGHTRVSNFVRHGAHVEERFGAAVVDVVARVPRCNETEGLR